jgi:CheY-like chemotaxis protein
MSLKEKICLIIDDDDEFRLILKRIIVQLGMVVKEANSIEESLKVLKTTIPHIIILDLGLKDDSGVRFIEIRNRTPQLENVPIIVCSANSYRKVILDVAELGAFAFIAKPIKQSYLIQKIRQALLNTEILSYSFEDSSSTNDITVNIAATLTKINEVFCIIRAPIKVNHSMITTIESKLFQEHHIDCSQIESDCVSRIVEIGEYDTKWNLVGISDQGLVSIRTLRNQWITNE